MLVFRGVNQNPSCIRITSHEIFPEPVRYTKACATLSRAAKKFRFATIARALWPKNVEFLSHWSVSQKFQHRNVGILFAANKRLQIDCSPKMNHFQRFLQMSSLRYPKMIEFELCFYHGLRGENDVWNNYTPCSGPFCFEKRESSSRKATSSKVPLE